MEQRVLPALIRRIGVGLVSAILVAAVAGGAYQVATHSPADDTAITNDAHDVEDPSTEEHGGSVERFHGDGDQPCDAPEGVSLEGNWTHGDYVSAWAATEDPEAVRDAARSDCGKPVNSMTRGNERAEEAKAAKLDRRPEGAGKPAGISGKDFGASKKAEHSSLGETEDENAAD